MFVARRHFDNVLEALDKDWLTDKGWNTRTKAKLAAFIVAPGVHISMDGDSHSVLVSATDLLDELIFELGKNPWVQYLLRNGFVRQMRVRVQT